MGPAAAAAFALGHHLLLHCYTPQLAEAQARLWPWPPFGSISSRAWHLILWHVALRGRLLPTACEGTGAVVVVALVGTSCRGRGTRTSGPPFACFQFYCGLV